VAKIPGYLGSALNRIGRQIVLNVGGSTGVVSITTSVDTTFDESSAMVSSINGGAASRNVTALASCEIVGMVKAFYNAGSTDNLVIRSSTPSTLATLKPGDWVVLFHNGTTWLVWSTVSATNELAAILATANTWTAAQAFSAAITSTSTMTTTGGVVGGTARKIGGPVHVKQGTTTVSNTTTETDLGTHTLEAGTVGLGTLVEITTTARITGITGTPNLNLKLYAGSTVLAQTTSVAVLANDYYQVTFRLVGQAAPSGASAVSTNGTVTAKISGTVATTVSSSTPATLATNGALTCKFTATWSAASASNTVVCDDFVITVTG
jgi:hypothetical protein